MVFDIGLLLTNTLAGILTNLPWFILIWLGFKLIAKEIKLGVQKIPEWINQYFKLHREQINIDRAVSMNK